MRETSQPYGEPWRTQHVPVRARDAPRPRGDGATRRGCAESFHPRFGKPGDCADTRTASSDRARPGRDGARWVRVRDGWFRLSSIAATVWTRAPRLALKVEATTGERRAGTVARLGINRLRLGG